MIMVARGGEKFLLNDAEYLLRVHPPSGERAAEDRFQPLDRLKGREGWTPGGIGKVPDDDVHDPVTQGADIFRIKPHVAMFPVEILVHAYRLPLLSSKSKYLLYVSPGAVRQPGNIMSQLGVANRPAGSRRGPRGCACRSTLPW